MRKQGGFTLIELMIVMTIIAIIAGITIPRVIQSKDTTHETTAQAYLRAIHQGELIFSTKFGRLATLDELKEEGYLNPAAVYAYWVVLTITPGGADFTATATPAYRATELRHFFVDGTGVVRYTKGAPADINSTPL